VVNRFVNLKNIKKEASDKGYVNFSKSLTEFKKQVVALTKDKNADKGFVE